MDGAHDYLKLPIKSYPSRSIRDTAEGKYWKRFRAPKTIQQVLIYDGISHKLKKTISRFPDTAYCGQFRSDGKLIVAGCESGLVQVFDLSSRAVLRQFTAHKRATHAAHFSSDKVHVLTGSDDTTVRWWDLAQSEQVARFDGHKDYVRCAASCAAHLDLWATGSYDHTCALWDVRTGEKAMTLEHGAPVESCAFFPTGKLFASAGGTTVCIWDVVAGRLLQRLTAHQKTVTGVSVVDVMDADSHVTSRLLSSALDGHVKVYDLDTFKVSYACKYPSPVLCAAVAPTLSSMTIGLADRSMVVRQHKRATSTLAPVGAAGVRLTKQQRRYAPKLTAAHHKYFVRGKNEKATAMDYVVAKRPRVKLREFDVLLKQFKYADALTAAIKTQRADVVASVIDELAARGGLKAALSGREADTLQMVLLHTCKYITNPRHSRTMLQIANMILDLYLPLLSKDSEFAALMEQLRGRIISEIKLQQDLRQLQGSLDLILNSAIVT